MVYKKVKRLSQTEKAYIAALIDGEGTITLSRNNKNKNRALIVEISNTDFKLLKWVETVISAGEIRKKQPQDKKYKMSFTYRIRNRQSLNLLAQILPYLKTYKQKRAKMVLKDYIKLTPRNGKYSPKLSTQRKKFIKAFFSIPSLKRSKLAVF